MGTLGTAADKRRAFRQLHASGCFVIPNPWNTGSARYLQSLGFKALATTSSGFAWSQGRPDASTPREAVLAQLRAIVDVTDVPINADFESGFAHDPDGVADSVRLAVDTGVAGLSIEDATGDPAQPLYELEAAVARIRAARNAIDRAGGDVMLVGRRMFPRRPSRSRRNDPATEGLRRCRRRLSLRSGHSHARADRCGRRRRRAETGLKPDVALRALALTRDDEQQPQSRAFARRCCAAAVDRFGVPMPLNRLRDAPLIRPVPVTVQPSRSSGLREVQ
jgi:hypothetical protein